MNNIWKRILLNINRVSMQHKFLGIIVLVIIGTSVYALLDFYATLQKTLGEQLTQRGISIARDIAGRSADFVFTNNIYGLHQLVNETIQNNPDIKYILIFDSRGEELINTFQKGIPKGLRNLNNWKKGMQGYHLVFFRAENQVIRDIAVPIFDGRGGTVRVGLSEETIRAGIMEAAKRVTFSSVLIILIGVVLGNALLKMLTKPISQLVTATQEVAAGNLDCHTDLWWAEDELRHLGIAFNRMIDSLKVSREEIRAYSEELEKKEHLRQQLLAKIIAAQEDERKRIARELHDQTSQYMALLRFGLRSLQQQEADPQHLKSLDELLKLSEKIMEELHNLALELRPSVLDDLGLEEAIRNYCREWQQRWAIPADYHFEGLGNTQLPSHIETAVYRIVQEALTNVAKYSGAQNASIVIQCSNGILRAIIEDDGRGFDVDEIMKGPFREKKLGLFGMQERAALLDGELIIESAPGQGCTVYVTIPLHKGASRDDSGSHC